jgi:hypothetical protein
MKYPILIASVFVLAGAFVWAGCKSSTSTSTGPTTPSGSLVIPSSINFGNARLGVCGDSLLGAPLDLTVSIKNTGTDTLHIHSAMPQASEFTVVSLDSVIPPSDSAPMQLQFCPSQLGNASGTFLVTSNATQDSSLTVTLTGNGVPYTPGLSSQYTYTAFDLDTAGNPIGSAFTVLDSVIATGLNYQGGSNVSETSDSTYYIITSSGDDSIYIAGDSTYPTTLLFGGGWQVLPFMSHGQNVYSPSEIYTNESEGETITLTIHDTARYVDQTTMTIGGVSYQTSHVHLLESAVYTDNLGSRTFVVTYEMYFSPILGTIVSQSRVSKEFVTLPSGKRDPSTGGGRKITLTSFKAN